MTIAYFLTYQGPHDDAGAFRDWFGGAPLATLRALPKVRAIELYTPEQSEDPYLNDGAGPVLMVQCDFDDVDDLEGAIATGAFRTAIADISKIPVPGLSLTHDALEVRWWPVGGDAAVHPRTAPVSYVVRYYPPAEDEAAFVDFYVSHHPQILAKLPNIRNVLCYLKVDWRDPAGIAHADTLLGNEVVFDSLDDLNASLKSDVRHELRDDYKNFPPFGGNVTHYAMTRRRVYP
jgi:hypothetical protein